MSTLRSKVRKTVSFRVSDYYDGGVVRLERVRVPSKRVGYKNENGVLVAKVPVGVPEFEDAIRKAFSGTMTSWPLAGRILVGIGLNLPKIEYETKDVDNMAKAILDAFKGIAYADDSQIDSLFISIIRTAVPMISHFHKTSGFRTVFMILGVMAAVTLLASFFFPGRALLKRQSEMLAAQPASA